MDRILGLPKDHFAFIDTLVGISLTVWVIFGISNVTVMVHTKIIILIDVASVPSRLTSCKIVLCVGVVVTI